MNRVVLCVGFALLLIQGHPSQGQGAIGIQPAVKDFSLPTANNGTARLFRTDGPEWTVVCFLGTECPLARIYGPRLQTIADEFADSVRFIGVNSNVQDSMEEIRDYVRAHKIRFEMVKDFDQSVAVDMKATRTPEVMVLDRGGRIRYRGRIDDQYQPGITRSKPTVDDLKDALQQLVSGKSVSRPITKAAGCLIALPKEPQSNNPTVTYCGQVARVLQKHCVECHRPGEIGPFALQDYDEVVGWADMMVEVVNQNRMPPWHANSDHGSFVNARIMPEADKQILRDWVEQGTPYGDAENLPVAADFKSGWRLPKQPDLVLEMNRAGFDVPADGIVEYQYFVVDPQFKEDKWVSAAQVIPGDASVVHHCIAFVRPPDGGDFRDFGILSGYVPGQRSTALPPGYARRIPAGAKIVFQMHYTPNGKPASDQSKLGLVFADAESVTHEVMAVVGIQQEFEIPPQQKNFAVTGKIDWLPEQGELLSMAPHMHLRGKSFRVSVTPKATGKGEILLDVPHYDFNWQHNYDLEQPIPTDSLQEITFEAVFDNSDANPTNPEPNEYVTWGDQTWQEMAVVFFSVAKPRKPTKVFDPNLRKKSEIEFRKRMEQLQDKADQFAENYINKLDKNGDGQLSTHELPASVRTFGYFDENGDQVISREEIARHWMYRQ